MVVERPVQRGPKLPERVARQIIQDVASGDRRPGDRLPPEAEMAALYGVGRATVREALRVLEIHGLIKLRTGPGGGPFVGQVDAASFARMSALYYQLSQATIRELIEARRSTEPVLARLAAKSRNDVVKGELDELLTVTDAVDLEDTATYDALAAQFHDVVGVLADNRILSLIGGSLMHLHRDRVMSGLTEAEQRRSVLVEHRRVGRAILAGRASLAERLMREHMDAVDTAGDVQVGMHSDVIDWE